MRLWVASSALAAAFLLTPVAAGHAPARGQDFSITNQMEPVNTGHRDLMRELQAWWDAHAYYPRHASNRDQSGTVEVNLVKNPVPQCRANDPCPCGSGKKFKKCCLPA
jgi:uncharacterized protein YecA (UPF0149 family)